MRAIGQIEGTLKTGLKNIDEKFLSVDKSFEKVNDRVDKNEKRIGAIEGWQNNTMGKITLVSSAVGLFVMFVSGIVRDWFNHIFKNNN
jgi:VIT1/CCC1 family predicted Fe2+/Mn2+ transporter